MRARTRAQGLEARALTVAVAAQHPEAKVVGTDLSAIQPRWLPINVRMYVDDCEGPEWLHGSGYDLVHFRGMAGILKDLDGVLQKAYLCGTSSLLLPGSLQR